MNQTQHQPQLDAALEQLAAYENARAYNAPVLVDAECPDADPSRDPLAVSA